MTEELRQRVRSDAETTLAALDAAAEMWSAAWEASPDGGRLHLPLLAGIRRGRLLGGVRIVEEEGGTEIRLTVEHEEYEVNRPALVFLILGALGAVVMLFAPFAPRLAGLLPLAVVLLLGAWLIVASRLRMAGARDFLEAVAELAEGDAEPPGEAPPPEPLEP